MDERIPDQDLGQALQEQVRCALATGLGLDIVGSGSKRFYGRRVAGEAVSVAGHRGIVDYQPGELVLTARCGTPLAAMEAELAARGQMLAFEPPHFGPEATLGGTVACGLSGPRRPYAGSVRDFVLGVKLLNGKAELLSFGGQVMKNVAGFDVSRLMAGALGTLGILLEISLKVLPRPDRESTLSFEMDIENALAAMNRWAGQGWPLSAACHEGNTLRIRLCGSEGSIAAASAKLGGDSVEEGDSFWADLREQRLAFFQGMDSLWRLSLPPAAPMPKLPGACLMEWGGALRWLRGDADANSVFAAAARAGGHATRFRGGDGTQPVFQALAPAVAAMHRRLKHAFDPQGVFNPGRMYEGW